MLGRQPNLNFQAKKIQSNSFCRFNQLANDEQYTIQQKIQPQRLPLEDKTNRSKGLQINYLQQNSQIVNLQDIWEALQSQNNAQHAKNQIQISIVNAQPEEILQFTLEQFQSLAKQQNNQPKPQQNLKEDTKEQPQDFGDLWQSVQKEGVENTLVNNTEKLQEHNEKQQEKQAVLSINELSKKNERFDLNELLNSKNDKSLNFNLSRDYLIYDYHKFVVGIFQTNIHSYFGFRETPTIKNTYYLYNLITKQNIIECFTDKCDDFLFSNTKNKCDYERDFCTKYKLCNTNYHFATAFHKYINNGILYNLKPFNSYESQYEDSFALIQINDGFIGQNCFCNTNVFISQKYTNQPGQLKMNIGMKNGYLIANMGVNGVKSAPYNCRLQNFQSNFVYLLGLVDKQNKQFIVRVGQGISPLIAFAISVGRKRYIQSFTQ